MDYELSEEYIIIIPKGDFNLHKVLYYKKLLEKYKNKKIIFDLSFTRNVNSEGIKFIFANKDKSKIINPTNIFLKCLKILELELSST
jgi:hypothetical protein